MLIPVDQIIPKKLLKKGLCVPIYEGSIGTDSLTLTLRETRHLEPAFIPRTLATFLNMVASLGEQEQALLQRLMIDVADGRECKYVDLHGRSLIFFPDQRGDPAYDVLLDIRTELVRRKAAPKAKTKSSKASAEAASKNKAGKL
jgi:hypothetical protein